MISPTIFEWIDLSHEISAQTPSWDGHCGFKHSNLVNYDECETECKFLVQQFAMSAGLGTHIDAPTHCFPQGKSLLDLPIQPHPCVVVDISQEAHENYIVDLQTLKKFEIQHNINWKNAFVIFYTGWSKLWNEPNKYRNDLRFPSISKAVADYLVSEDIMGLGIDTLSPDRPDSQYPVHQAILGSGKYIVENIANAHRLPPTGSFVLILPLKIPCTESPTRLIGIIPT